jgi:predicted DCC family thiol-disulfide oxidoreductase YuxK
VIERFPELTHDRMMSEMVIVDTSGEIHGGSDAVRYLSRRLPLLWPAMPILHLPGSAWLWRWFYNQVARKRYWLSEKFFGGDPTCEDGACTIHFAKNSKTKSID